MKDGKDENKSKNKKNKDIPTYEEQKEKKETFKKEYENILKRANQPKNFKKILSSYVTSEEKNELINQKNQLLISIQMAELELEQLKFDFDELEQVLLSMQGTEADFKSQVQRLSSMEKEMKSIPDKIEKSKNKLFLIEQKLDYATILLSEKELDDLADKINELFKKIENIPVLKILPDYLTNINRDVENFNFDDIKSLVRTNPTWCRKLAIVFPVYDEQDILGDDKVIPTWGLKYVTNKTTVPAHAYGTMEVTLELGYKKRMDHEMAHTRGVVGKNKETYRFMYDFDYVRTEREKDGTIVDIHEAQWIQINMEKPKEAKKWQERIKDDREFDREREIFARNFFYYLKELEGIFQSRTVSLSRNHKERYNTYKKVIRFIKLSETYFKILIFRGESTKKEMEKVMKIQNQVKTYVNEMIAFLDNDKYPPLENGEIDPEEEKRYLIANPKLRSDYKIKADITSILNAFDPTIPELFKTRPEQVSAKKESDEDSLLIGTFGADEEEPIVFRTISEIERLRNPTKKSRRIEEEQAVLAKQVQLWREIQRIQREKEKEKKQ